MSILLQTNETGSKICARNFCFFSECSLLMALKQKKNWYLLQFASIQRLKSQHSFYKHIKIDGSAFLSWWQSETCVDCYTVLYYTMLLFGTLSFSLLFYFFSCSENKKQKKKRKNSILIIRIKNILCSLVCLSTGIESSLDNRKSLVSMFLIPILVRTHLRSTDLRTAVAQLFKYVHMRPRFYLQLLFVEANEQTSVFPLARVRHATNRNSCLSFSMNRLQRSIPMFLQFSTFVLFFFFFFYLSLVLLSYRAFSFFEYLLANRIISP